jgi:hypothetical protein
VSLTLTSSSSFFAGWFLLDGWWAPAQTQAFLDAVPDQSLIVLDLWSEVAPYWNAHDNFYGKHLHYPSLRI